MRGKEVREPGRQTGTWEGALEYQKLASECSCVFSLRVWTYALEVLPESAALFMIVCECESQWCPCTTYTRERTYATTHLKYVIFFPRSLNHKNLVLGNNWVYRPWSSGLMDGQFQQREIITACQPPPIQTLVCVCPLPACYKWPHGHTFLFIVPKPGGSKCVCVDRT